MVNRERRYVVVRGRSKVLGRYEQGQSGYRPSGDGNKARGMPPKDAGRRKRRGRQKGLGRRSEREKARLQTKGMRHDRTLS